MRCHQRRNLPTLITVAQEASTFLDAGWDFEAETTNGTADLWWIREGQDYPRLSWEHDPDQP